MPSIPLEAFEMSVYVSLSSKVPKNGCKRLYTIFTMLYIGFIWLTCWRVRSSTWVEISKEVAYSCEISTFVLKLTEKVKLFSNSFNRLRRWNMARLFTIF